MGDFANRLRIAITNYADGAISYKGFASLVDIPYRTLQNYITGERSPNIEALQKLSANGINIDWLITGAGLPYTSQMPPKDVIDDVFLLHMMDIIHADLADDSALYYDEKLALLSFCTSNNYLGIGEVVHALLDSGAYADTKALLSEIARGDIDYMLDSTPRSSKELWNARRKVKDVVRRSLRLPPAREGEQVGE